MPSKSPISAPPRRLLDMEHAAAYLDVSVWWLHDRAKARTIPSVKVGRHVRFDIADLDELIAAGRREAKQA